MWIGPEVALAATPLVIVIIIIITSFLCPPYDRGHKVMLAAIRLSIRPSVHLSRFLLSRSL